MTALGDALGAIRNVVLMQERIDGLRSDVTRVMADLKAVTEKVGNLNERVIRIETMIEMSRGAPPRLEG